jgi:hypothetical protein
VIGGEPKPTSSSEAIAPPSCSNQIEVEMMNRSTTWMVLGLLEKKAPKLFVTDVDAGVTSFTEPGFFVRDRQHSISSGPYTGFCSVPVPCSKRAGSVLRA